MPTFPELGPVDGSGCEGMFIADTHDDPSHLQALVRAIPVLAGRIDVLFIEAFYADQNPGVKTPGQIQQHLDARSFAWTPDQARRLYDLAAETAAYRIELRGIDAPLSSTWAPKFSINYRRAAP